MQKQVDVAQSVDAVAQALVLLVEEIKAKATIGQIVASELAALPSLFAAVSNIGNDIKSDLPGVYNAAALGMAGILEVLLTAPQVTKGLAAKAEAEEAVDKGN